MQRNQNDVNQGPHAESPEAKQLPDPLLPVPQVETVCPEATERDAQNQSD